MVLSQARDIIRQYIANAYPDPILRALCISVDNLESSVNNLERQVTNLQVVTNKIALSEAGGVDYDG